MQCATVLVLLLAVHRVTHAHTCMEGVFRAPHNSTDVSCAGCVRQVGAFTLDLSDNVFERRRFHDVPVASRSSTQSLSLSVAKARVVPHITRVESDGQFTVKCGRKAIFVAHFFHRKTVVLCVCKRTVNELACNQANAYGACHE